MFHSLNADTVVETLLLWGFGFFCVCVCFFFNCHEISLTMLPFADWKGMCHFSYQAVFQWSTAVWSALTTTHCVNPHKSLKKEGVGSDLGSDRKHSNTLVGQCRANGIEYTTSYSILVGRTPKSNPKFQILNKIIPTEILQTDLSQVLNLHFRRIKFAAKLAQRGHM